MRCVDMPMVKKDVLLVNYVKRFVLRWQLQSTQRKERTGREEQRDMTSI
jgi:hypothetical protein